MVALHIALRLRETINQESPGGRETKNGDGLRRPRPALGNKQTV